MNSHLSPRELLRYLDGELPGRRSRSAQAHLLSCWRCRTELERLKQDISLIVDAQNCAYLPALPPPARPWASFEEMTASLPASRSLTGAWWRLANYLAHGGPARWTVAVLTLLCILATTLWLIPARLSAEGVLHNLDAADSVRTPVKTSQALRQRIRVQRLDRRSSAKSSTELEFWKSGALSLWRGEDNDLHRLYQDREIDAVLPLSASACKRWLSETGAKAKVSSNGRAIEILSAGEGRDLESVSVRVSSDDWRVEAMRLTFSDSIFDVSELDLTVLRKEELSPELLDALAPPRPANPPQVQVARATEPKPNIAAMEVPVGEPPINLPELELRVLAGLHQIGADLSEPIGLKLEPPRIVMSAASVSEARKQQLVEMFGSDPRLRLDIDASALLSRGPITELEVPPPSTPGGPDKLLSDFFGGADAEERFTRAVLASDESILSRFYALRNLAEHWPPDVEATLSREAGVELSAMAENHSNAIRGDLPRLKVLLVPLIERFCNEIVSLAGDAGPAASWREFALSGLSTARILDRSLRASLTTSANATSIGQTCPSIREALSSLELDLANLPAAH